MVRFSSLTVYSRVTKEFGRLSPSTGVPAANSKSEVANRNEAVATEAPLSHEISTSSPTTNSPRLEITMDQLCVG